MSMFLFFMTIGLLVSGILFGITYGIYEQVKLRYNKIIAFLSASIIPILFSIYVFLSWGSGIELFLIPGVLLFLYVSLPFVIAYFVYKWAKRRLHKYIALALVLIIPIIFYYPIYIAVHPPDDFYKYEFKEIVGMDFPKSGDIIRKRASYPDFHGDYCSSALIEFSEDDYQQILEYVKGSMIFDNNTIMGSDIYYSVIGSISDEEFIYKASYYPKDDYRFIGFLNDGKTIIIHLANS